MEHPVNIEKWPISGFFFKAFSRFLLMDSPFPILKLMDGPIFENLADFGLTSAILYGTPCKLLENGPFPDFFFSFFAVFYLWMALFGF